MGIGGYKIRNPNEIHFITFAVVEWVDVFTRSCYSDLVVESLRFCQKHKGLKIYAWVIMSNHLHLIVSATEGANLSDILRDFKKFTAKRIIKAIQENYRESRQKWMLDIFKIEGQKNARNVFNQFWRQTNHPIELRSPRMKYQRLDYLHNNPVKAGIVTSPEYYKYSSAVSYNGKGGLLDIEFL